MVDAASLLSDSGYFWSPDTSQVGLFSNLLFFSDLECVNPVEFDQVLLIYRQVILSMENPLQRSKKPGKKCLISDNPDFSSSYFALKL